MYTIKTYYILYIPSFGGFESEVTYLGNKKKKTCSHKNFIDKTQSVIIMTEYILFVIQIYY